MDNILIIEDNDDMQHLLQKVLQAQYHIISAYSGTERLLVYKRANKVDLILLDRCYLVKTARYYMNYGKVIYEGEFLTRY